MESKPSPEKTGLEFHIELIGQTINAWQKYPVDCRGATAIRRFLTERHGVSPAAAHGLSGAALVLALGKAMNVPPP